MRVSLSLTGVAEADPDPGTWSDAAADPCGVSEADAV